MEFDPSMCIPVEYGDHVRRPTVEDKIAATARLRWQQVRADDDTSGGFWVVEKTPSYLKSEVLGELLFVCKCTCSICKQLYPSSRHLLIYIEALLPCVARIPPFTR